MAMANPVERHLDEEAAEKYSLGQLSARKVVEIETHFLVCESCRQKVAASDAYVAAMRNAAAKLRKKEQTPRRRVAGK
jgi:anti-sigma factor ChrR (cupin superfamily)